MPKYINPIPVLDPQKGVSKISKTPKEKEILEVDYMYQKNVYFVFIDILGFKSKFKNDNTENNSKKCRQVFNYYFYLMDPIRNKGFDNSALKYAGQTSDSLYFYTDNIYLLYEFIKVYSHFSLYAMTKDIFFRGGAAQGDLFHKEKHQFYGNSVIKAYLLESEICKNPTIVFDEKIYKLFKSNFSDSKKLIKKYEGRYILSPFAYLSNEFELSINYKDTFQLITIDITLLEETILNNIKTLGYGSKDYSKYIFLLNEFKEYKKINKNKIRRQGHGKR